MHIVIGILGIIFFLAPQFYLVQTEKIFAGDICWIAISNSTNICIYIT